MVPNLFRFYRKFRMNYPVVMGNAQIGELYEEFRTRSLS
jgi:hypothetical protein